MDCGWGCVNKLIHGGLRQETEEMGLSGSVVPRSIFTKAAATDNLFAADLAMILLPPPYVVVTVFVAVDTRV